jgi:DNA-binding GntR family transcriptional regulator
MGRAETAFREAFDRLKRGRPNLLPKGTPVTQNNVAREAGLDPSALKKTRFPVLVAEIQDWISQNEAQQTSTPSKSIYAQRNRNRSLREQIEALKAQRDNALALLVDADARIVALTMENQRLLATKPISNIARITKPDLNSL